MDALHKPIILILYMAAFVSYSLHFWKNKSLLVAKNILALGCIAQFLLSLHTLIKSPYISESEVLFYCTPFIVLAYLLFEFKFKTSSFYFVILPLVIIMVAVSMVVPTEDTKGSLPHIITAFISISIMSISFASSLLYLIEWKLLKAKKFGKLFQN